jgi:hypothetical protein
MHIFNSKQKKYYNIVYILVGFLSNELKLAIKLLSKSQQVVIEFLNEVVLLINVKHKNLVTLKGSFLHGILDIFLFTNVWEKKNCLNFMGYDHFKNPIMKFSYAMMKDIQINTLHLFMSKQLVHLNSNLKQIDQTISLINYFNIQILLLSAM